MISAALIRKEKIKIIFILMVLFILFSGCAAKEKQDTSDPYAEVKLMAATDLHYLSETLYDENSMIFRQLKESNDGKLFEESTAILEALKEKDADFATREATLAKAIEEVTEETSAEDRSAIDFYNRV